MAMSGTCNAYNPLSANIVERVISAEVWVCTAAKPVGAYRGASLEGAPQRELRHGEALSAEKEGDWLVLKGTDLCAPFFDEHGNRNFKNQRTLAMEAAAKPGGYDLRKPASDKSLGGRSTYASESSDHGAPPAQKGSFRWVDAQGAAHQLDNDDDLHTEVWVCVSHHSVPLRSSRDHSAIVFDRAVPVGGKVNVVKEDDEWLRVVEISESFDAAELLGRRSLHLAKHLTEKDTHLYLPISQHGARLFMPEQLALFEASGAKETAKAPGAAHELRRQGSERSAAGAELGRSFSRQGSFGWVDGHGVCHRAPVDADADVRSELWVCVSNHSVPYRSARDLSAIVFDKAVHLGGKVNVVKEDEEWLRVLEVCESLDTAELFGRRSLHLATHLTEKETGLWLPISQHGVRLFMPEQLALFEASGARDPAHVAQDAQGGCSLM